MSKGQIEMKRVWMAALILLAGCDGSLQAQPTARYTLGEVIESVDFNQSFQWEHLVMPAIHMRIEAGAYRASASSGELGWTLGTRAHTDVLIQVDTLQFSDDRDNAYGVMCRASSDNNSDGYYFMISADGQYTIRRGANYEVEPLIPWTPASAIQQDKSVNRIRALCLGDRLALWVNGTFVAETRDDFYRRGVTGLTVGVPENGNLDVQFDDLIVWEALPG